MKTLIVYDSVFGNTAKVALAMETALKEKGDVKSVQAMNFSKEQLQGCTNLLIGSPTRAFQPTPVIKQLVSGLSKKDLENLKVCVFDTRMDIGKVDVWILKIFAGWFGFANDTMQKKLRRKTKQKDISAAGFTVEGSEGPLLDGELEHAAMWVLEQVK
jgi:flavodoxin